MKVTFLHAAEHDLGSLFSYIKDKLQNEIAARNVATKLLQRTQMLANFPELGVNLTSIDPRLVGYRYLLVDNYLVIYKITDEEVCIVRILYARSDYVQLLQG
ncbi:MAG TPA: type II toxin-antitoxin system RelE/ParE family toxin [Candidatus Limnocylindria bacterium]|nr:type II toxin-antitoxin system RelE/ParE family toxin [Candidatus Limnocylindria bacterium]